jgi:hypothetical protein
VWVEIAVVSGPTPDAGAKDTGTPDTGTTHDAAAQPDAGPDASAKDGAAKDGSAGATQSDSGSPNTDSGSSPGLYNKRNEDDSGCGCRAVGDKSGQSRGSAGSALLILLFAASSLARRKRHN